MKKISIIIMILLLLVIAGGCAEGNDAGGEVNSITPDEFKEMMDNDEDFILVDVRTQEEYDEGHIIGSILIPVDVIKDQAEQILTDKESKIIIYCRTGNRFQTAGEILKDLGYKNIYDLGGIVDWPYETVR